MKGLHKQCLSLLLSVLMILSMGILPVAAEQEADATAETVIAVEVPAEHLALVEKWAALGIIPADTDPTAVISRVETAKVIANILGVANVAPFAHIVDVPADAAGAVRAVIDLGFFDPVESNFRPDESLYISGALKMMCVLIGYPQRMLSSGGSLALQARLSKGINVSYGSECTWATFLELLENAAEEDLVRIIGYVDGKAFSAEVTKGTTFLSEYVHIFETEGRIDATSITALVGSKTGSGIRIDGVHYDDKAGLTDKIARDVKVWYSVARNGDRTALYAEPADDEVIYTIADVDILPATNTSTVHFVNEEDEDDEIDVTGATFLFNGHVLSAPTVDDLKPVTGQLQIIDVADDGDGDIVYISSVETFVVKEVNAKSLYLSDKYNDEKILRLDEDCEYTVLKRGVAISFADIIKNNVVYVGMSKDGDYALIDVYAAQQKGVLTGRTSDSIFIDDKEFPVAAANADIILGLALGAQYTFFEGMGGTIAGAVETVNEDTYGYLTRAKTVTSGLSNGAVLRIFSATYGLSDYNTAEKVYVNGVRKTPAEMITILKDGGSEVADQAVMFRLNADGELSHLQIAVTTPAADLYNEALFSKDWEFSNVTAVLPGLMASKYIFDGSMTTFSVPKDGSGNVMEDDIAVVNSSTMNFDGFTYSGVVYDATADRNVKLFIWERASGSSGADLTTDRSQFMVVNKVYKKLNKDNEIVTVVDGFYDRLPVEYVVSEKCVASNGEAAVLVDHDALDLQFGDVIHASLDGGGRMQGFKRVFTLDEREGNLSPFNKGIFGCAGWNVSIATPYSAASVGDSNLGSLGNWASVHIDPVRVMGNNMLVNAHTGLVDSLIAPYGYNSVLVVDEASKTIRTGSPAADVMPYDENQTVLLQMMNGRYQHLIIINHEPDVEYASWMYEPFTTAELNSAGLPYHVGGAERWSADGAVLNYALVANPADATDTVLKITNGSEQNNSMNMVVTDVAKPTQNPMAFSLRFRLYIDEFTNDAGASFRIGNSANSVSIHDGALWLRTGAGESKILDYTTDTWYELCLQVAKQSATSTTTTVFVDGVRAVKRMANDGDWTFNGEDRGYFNLENAGEGDAVNMAYTVYVDDVYLDWDKAPENVNYDGEVPVFTELQLPDYLQNEEFVDTIVTGGIPSNGSGDLSWNAGMNAFEVMADPDDPADNILKISLASGTAHWPVPSALSCTRLATATPSEYTVEFRFKMSASSSHAWAQRPFGIYLGNTILGVAWRGGESADLFITNNLDWGGNTPPAAKGTARLAGINGWATIKLRVYQSGGQTVKDLWVNGTQVATALADFNTTQQITPQADGGYLRIGNGINSQATCPWSVYLDYVKYSQVD